MAGGIAVPAPLQALPAGSAMAWRPAERLAEQLADGARAVALKEWWKYSSLPGYAETLATALASAAETRLESRSVRGITLSPLNLLPAAEQERLGEFLSAGERLRPYPLAQALIRSVAEGWHVAVAAGADAPLVLNQGSGAELIVVDVAPGAELQLLTHAGATAAHAGVLILNLGHEARVTHALLDTGSQVDAWHLRYVTLGRNAQYRHHQQLICDGRQRHETHLSLSGDGARAEVTIAAAAGGRGKLDQQLRVEHQARHTESEETVHLLGRGRAELTFNGRIHIHPGAAGTRAELSNRNIALDSEVRFNTKPELEIYNDDVRCAHGATVGQLDPDALFFLQSRGLDAQAARRLLCSAFLGAATSGPLAEPAKAAFRALFT